MSSALVDAVETLLAELAACDEASLFGSQLRERLPVLLQARNAMDAACARTVAHGERTGLAEHDGLKNTPAWLRGHGRLSGSAAHRMLAAGRALDRMPALGAAFAAGAVTADQVAVLAPVVSDAAVAAAARAGLDPQETDEVFTQLAMTAPHRDLVVAVGHYLDRLDPDGPEPDPTALRGLTLSRRGDGTVGLHGQLDAVGAEKVQAALEAVAAAGRCARDERSPAQQRADALVQLADVQLASGNLPIHRGKKAHVGVLIGLRDLLDPAVGKDAADLYLGDSVSAAKARLLACDADVFSVFLGEHDQPLALGRTKRVVDAPLRKAVEIRDKGCVFAGCSNPAHYCEAHHLVHWIHGGDTDLDNLALLCERHHTQVHHGFTVERMPDNTYRTFRPDGSQIRLDPPLDVDRLLAAQSGSGCAGGSPGTAAAGSRSSSGMRAVADEAPGTEHARSSGGNRGRPVDFPELFDVDSPTGRSAGAMADLSPENLADLTGPPPSVHPPATMEQILGMGPRPRPPNREPGTLLDR